MTSRSDGHSLFRIKLSINEQKNMAESDGVTTDVESARKANTSELVLISHLTLTILLPYYTTTLPQLVIPTYFTEQNYFESLADAANG